MKIWIDTTSAGVAPAAANAAATLAAAAANWSASVDPARVPSAWWAVWPARNTSRPGAATATWENPNGGAMLSGLRNWWAATVTAPSRPGAAARPGL